MRRTSVAIATLVLLASACSSGIGKPGESAAVPSLSPAASIAPAASHPAQATASAPTAAPASLAVASQPASTPLAHVGTFLVVAEKGNDALRVIAANTGEQAMSLPAGIPVAGWHRILTATPSNGATVLGVFRFENIDNPASLTIDGTWRFPNIGDDPTLVGLSGDASTQVLVDASAGAATAATSRFAVVPASLQGKPQFITLRGYFEYDAISTDGRKLYVVEHLAGPPAGHYQVRQVDVPAGTLEPGVVVDKSNVSEAMAGWPLGQVRLASGRVLTLYRGAEHPFIHVLDTVQAFAVCIDLPATGAGNDAAALDWGIADASAGRVYAVNPTLGLVVEVDPQATQVLRSVTLEPLAGTGITLAKFGDGVGGQVGRRAIVAPGGETLYAAGSAGIVGISTVKLKASGRWFEGRAVDGLALSTDGGQLFALLHASGRIAVIDTAAGTVLGMVPGAGYTRLAAALPAE